jgi:calcineurin-like phosphoesterase
MPLTGALSASLRGASADHQETAVVVVDFHAEATSEDGARWFLGGKVSAVIGTTHIRRRRADVGQPTAYISDVGMTGPYDSVIGMEVQTSLSRFLTGLHTRFGSVRASALLRGPARGGRIDRPRHSIRRIDLTS